MATSPSLGRGNLKLINNPQNLFIAMGMAISAIFIIGLILSVVLSWRESSRLLEYEFQIILKSNGAYLQRGDIRDFVEVIPNKSRGFSFFEKNELTGNKLNFANFQPHSYLQCTSQSYMQYELSFCRPFIIPWMMLFTLAGLFTLVSLIFIIAFTKINRGVINEFKKLFTSAGINYEEKLTFSKAWQMSGVMASLVRKTQLESIENERNRVVAQVARQVAHDIRSPLSALTMVYGTLTDIRDEQRLLMRNATQRINDIANDLLQRGKKDQQTVKNNIEFIPALVDVLVSEKRIQIREHTGILIENNFENSFGAFAKVNSIELKRILSNLVNNSIEAFEEKNGQVTVGVKSHSDQNKVEVFVNDNGSGIPEHVLMKLGSEGITYGKIGIESGSGLGVYHAKKTIESFGGEFQIKSVLGSGTTVQMFFPLVAAPAWFVSCIDFTSKKKLVSLDDDISIHQIWSNRLVSYTDAGIEHLKIQSASTFEKYVKENFGDIKSTIFLVDFELRDQAMTGLDLIEDLGIQDLSILVTSRYEEKYIQERAAKIGLRILPKSLTGSVPLLFVMPKIKYDWILLDDDEIPHMTWQMTAVELGKKFIGYKSLVEFNAAKVTFSKHSSIYIDSNLGQDLRGENIARDLFAEGFRNLYLATGYEPDQFGELNFLKGIVGKEPPKA